MAVETPWGLVVSFAILGARHHCEPWDIGWHLSSGFAPSTNSLLATQIRTYFLSWRLRLQGPKGFIELPVRAAPGPGWEVQKAPCSPISHYYSILKWGKQ